LWPTGQDDTTVPFDWGQHTSAELLVRDVNVQFRIYPGLEHEIGEEQVLMVNKYVSNGIWLTDCPYHLFSSHLLPITLGYVSSTEYTNNKN
jgi:hypothetical protein